MKTLLTLLFSGLSISAATLYPVMTDSSSRLYPGGQTNFATLNGTNVWAGTNTFTGSLVFGTNSGVVGFHVWTLSSNVFLSNVVQTNQTATNAGGFANITPLATITVPAAKSVRSLYTFAYAMEKTNNTAGATSVYFYGGTNTNFIGSFTALNTTTTKAFSPDLSSLLWCNHSATNQIQGTSLATPAIVSPTNFVDTSAPWTLYIGLGAATGDSTNIFFRQFSLTEKAYP